MKIKKSQLKIFPPVALEPRPLINSDSKSNTIFSGLTGHLGTFSYVVITFVRGVRETRQELWESTCKSLHSFRCSSSQHNSI